MIYGVDVNGDAPFSWKLAIFDNKDRAYDYYSSYQKQVKKKDDFSFCVIDFDSFEEAVEHSDDYYYDDRDVG